ncbi:MAG: PPOX class F420-dependent oxidoreductase [Acidobacteriota bacterium]
MTFEDLRREKYISLATFRKTGREVATPVWFAHDEDGSLVVVTGGDSGKVKRLRNSSRSRIAVCDFKGEVRDDAEWLETETLLVSDEAFVQSAHGLLLKKYGWQMRLLDAVAWVGGRIPGRQYLRIGPAGASPTP